MLNKLKNSIVSYKLNNYFTKFYLDCSVLILFMLIGFYLNWSLKIIIASGLAIWIFLNPIKGSVLAKIAIVCLALTPFALALRRNDRAEELSILSFIFFGLAVVMVLWEDLSSNKRS